MKTSPPLHYVIPGMGELIDVLKAKLTVGEWQAFCWASAEQYLFRFNTKGDAVMDLCKLITYSGWLSDSVREHGVQMGGRQ